MKFFIESIRLSLKWAIERFESSKQVFTTYHIRPMKASRVKTVSDQLRKLPGYAIVMQGPMVTKYNFTLETLRLYKKHFAGAILILSTWKGEDEATLLSIRKEGVTIILNDTVEYAGPRNINLQIRSAAAGILEARRQNAEYVMKTRTDQRMYNPNVAEYFFNLMNAFHCSVGFKQSKRIIGIAFGRAKYKLYHFSDTLMFGTLQDMETYWRDEYVTKNVPRAGQGDFSAEGYLFRRFLKNIGREVRDTLKDSWEAYTTHCVIVDVASLDWYWYRYNRHSEYRHLNYKKHPIRGLSFMEWFNLYQGMENKIEYKDSHLSKGISFLHLQ